MLRNCLRGREVVAVRSKASGKRAAAALSNGVAAGVNRRQRTKTTPGDLVRALPPTTLS